MHERKYMIKDGRLVKRIGEKPVPDDEPLFIFRAKDSKALIGLIAYHISLNNLDQMAEVIKSIEDFRKWQEKNPEKMGEPTP